MKLSIITVCFNSSQTIALTLRSVREQTYSNIEHIVVDGASTDGTLEIVSTEGAHIAKLLTGRDEGIYDAMNKGIQLATGDVIAFLNADDFYKDSESLSHIAAVMQAENLDALYGDVDFFRSGRQDLVVRRYNSRRFSAATMAWGWMPAHPAFFVRKAMFEQYGLFRTDYRIAGDYEFIVRVFKNPVLRYRYLPKTLVSMQLGGVSTSGWKATLNLNREMIRACRENSVKTNWFKILLRYPLKALEFFPPSL